MRWVVVLLAAVAGVVVLAVAVILATSSDESFVFDLDVGECFDLGDDVDAGIGTVRGVDCSDPHEAEVVATGRLNEDGTFGRPADDELFALVDARCAEALEARPDVLERFGILPVVADEASWDPYDGAFVCVAIPFGGGTTTGSALAAES